VFLSAYRLPLSPASLPDGVEARREERSRAIDALSLAEFFACYEDAASATFTAPTSSKRASNSMILMRTPPTRVMVAQLDFYQPGFRAADSLPDSRTSGRRLAVLRVFSHACQVSSRGTALAIVSHRSKEIPTGKSLRASIEVPRLQELHQLALAEPKVHTYTFRRSSQRMPEVLEVDNCLKYMPQYIQSHRRASP